MVWLHVIDHQILQLASAEGRVDIGEVVGIRAVLERVHQCGMLVGDDV